MQRLFWTVNKKRQFSVKREPQGLLEKEVGMAVCWSAGICYKVAGDTVPDTLGLQKYDNLHDGGRGSGRASSGLHFQRQPFPEGRAATPACIAVISLSLTRVPVFCCSVLGNPVSTIGGTRGQRDQDRRLLGISQPRGCLPLPGPGRWIKAKF